MDGIEKSTSEIVQKTEDTKIQIEENHFMRKKTMERK